MACFKVSGFLAYSLSHAIVQCVFNVLCPPHVSCTCPMCLQNLVSTPMSRALVQCVFNVLCPPPCLMHFLVFTSCLLTPASFSRSHRWSFQATVAFNRPKFFIFQAMRLFTCQFYSILIECQYIYSCLSKVLFEFFFFFFCNSDMIHDSHPYVTSGKMYGIKMFTLSHTIWTLFSHVIGTVSIYTL